VFEGDAMNTMPEGSFLNGFLRLREKLAPMLALDLALFAPRREVGAYACFNKLASGAARGNEICFNRCHKSTDNLRILMQHFTLCNFITQSFNCSTIYYCRDF
jgi:hypothetical protein